ncbi:MAG: hypothetical protein GY711_07285 [bacterium]|nr:hypothetical protein [bacterium]
MHLYSNMTKGRHIKQLEKAGCVYARIAFESANDYIRNAVFRKNTTLEDELDTVRLNIQCRVDHPLVSIMQPYPMFDIEDTTKEMGYAVAAYDDFPVKFNRTSSIEFENKRQIENLHKLFPIVVRH